MNAPQDLRRIAEEPTMLSKKEIEVTRKVLAEGKITAYGAYVQAGALGPRRDKG